MNPTNTGSFGNGQASPELLAAISRRAGGNPGGTMAQTTASAPTNSPTTQLPPPMPSSTAPTSTAVPATPQVGMEGRAVLPGIPETETIIKALDSRLKSYSKVMEMEAGIR